MKKLLGGTGAAIGVKVLTGIVAAAAAITVAGAATTGSLNPQNWGQQVSHEVQVCKDSLRASGTRGIGQCVSAFAKQHGDMVSDSHHASGARDNNGKGNGNGKGKGKGKDNGKGNGTNGSGNGKDHGKGSGSDSGSTSEAVAAMTWF